MNSDFAENKNKSEPFLQVADLSKTYVSNKTKTEVLKNISFEVRIQVLAVVLDLRPVPSAGYRLQQPSTPFFLASFLL